MVCSVMVQYRRRKNWSCLLDLHFQIYLPCSSSIHWSSWRPRGSSWSCCLSWKRYWDLCGWEAAESWCCCWWSYSLWRSLVSFRFTILHIKQHKKIYISRRSLLQEERVSSSGSSQKNQKRTASSQVDLSPSRHHDFNLKTAAARRINV